MNCHAQVSTAGGGARRQKSLLLVAALLVVISASSFPGAAAGAAADGGYTDPTEVMRLLDLRDELRARGLGYLLKNWKCPDETNPATCNPCGKYSGADDSWGFLNGGGAWEHIACRTYDITPEEFPPGTDPKAINVTRSGFVTTIHLTDLGIEGTLESMGAVFCPFVHLRELDLDGSHLTGPLPEWLSTCFPHLHELDLSFGRLSGTIPKWVKNMPKTLRHFKVQHNNLRGVIPAEVSQMENLRVLWLHHNDFEGALDKSLASMKHLLSFDVRYNPRLCGALPNIQIDWAAHWAARGTEREDWFGFCDKASSENSACGVMASKGTNVGTDCTAVKPNATCSRLWGQCGGTASPVIYKKQAIAYDTYNGPLCCEGDAKCAYRDAYYSQCVPIEGAVSQQVLNGQTDDYRLPDSRTCGATSQSCGGAKGLYYGPTSCCNPAEVCVQQNYYVSQCLPAAEASAVLKQQSADAAWNAQMATSKAANSPDKVTAAKTLNLHGEKQR